MSNFKKNDLVYFYEICIDHNVIVRSGEITNIQDGLYTLKNKKEKFEIELQYNQIFATHKDAEISAYTYLAEELNRESLYFYNKVDELKATENTNIHNLATSTKPYKIGYGNGLYLLVHNNGSKYWRFKFRFNGKEKSLSLGVYPVVTVETARKQAIEAKFLIAKGIDPASEKQRRKNET
jgi:hypothetical protein